MASDTTMTFVERGAALLDDRRPGWFNEIDLDTLNIEMPGECVIGQLYGGESGSFHEALDDLDIDTPLIFGVSIDGMALGGDTERMHTAFAELTTEWTRLILERRQATN